MHPRSSWIQQDQTFSDEELNSEEGDEVRKIGDEDIQSLSNFIENGKKISRIKENLYAESLVQVPDEKVL